MKTGKQLLYEYKYSKRFKGFARGTQSDYTRYLSGYVDFCDNHGIRVTDNESIEAFKQVVVSRGVKFAPYESCIKGFLDFAQSLDSSNDITTATDKMSTYEKDFVTNIIVSYTNSLTKTSTKKCYRNYLFGFRAFAPDIFDINNVKNYFISIGSSRSYSTVEGIFYAILGVWRYYKEHRNNTSIDIDLLSKHKSEFLGFSQLSSESGGVVQQLALKPSADLSRNDIVEFSQFDAINSDVVILKAKLRQIKLCTNNPIVASQQSIIDTELLKRGYNTMSEWLIDRGDLLIAKLELVGGH